MGLWSWLFPSREDRIARARTLLATNRPEFARLELLDLVEKEPESTDDAKKLLHEAENQLAIRNLDAAIGYASQREDVKAAECLELAESFHHGGLEQRFTDTRRELREIRAHRDEQEERSLAEQRARLLAVDPLGVTGGPSWLDPATPENLFDADREEIEQRVALMVEGYPPSLRGSVTALGPEFAQAVLALDEGRPDEALQVLLALPDDSALVCWERARVAHALGDPVAAARSVQAFAKYAGAHHPMGNTHSGVYLAQLLAEAGDLAGGLRVMRDVVAENPKLPPTAGYLFAQLLFANRDLAEAEKVLSSLIRQHPKEPALYTLLARVRVAGGHRMEAMRALEASIEAICCAPGKCGTQKPDLDTHRLLATLYLEDGLDLPRGLELAGTAAGLVAQPTWEDAYLTALVAKARGAPEAPELARRLSSLTPPEHAGQERIARYLALPAPGPG
jgi:tetratricopeptide (TPR) repeat protein